MTDELLRYYNRELSFVRNLADEFARDQPEAASNIGIRPGACDDPHVSRLIESFSYLTARIRRKLDDEFPELTDAFLDVVFPHYLAPIPSAAIVQFQLDKGQRELATGYDVQRHEAVEVTDPSVAVDGDVPTCKYRTCYDATLWPIEVAGCELIRRPFVAPQVPALSDTLSILHLTLRCLSPNMKFGAFDGDKMRSLRFFLSGHDHHTMPLYELLLNDVLQIGIAASPNDATPSVLGPDALEPVGFGRNEHLLPYDARTFAGYMMLTEYFAFPQKFLFVDLKDLLTHPKIDDLGELHVFFYLNRSYEELEPHIDQDSVRLGCVPIINLFTKRAEPIRLTQTQTEYPVVPDNRLRRETEVYSVTSVEAASGDGRVEFIPLYQARLASLREQKPTFWHSHRRPIEARDFRGTETSLTLADVNMTPFSPADQTLIIETVCLNRDIPSSFRRPKVRLLSGGPLEEIQCLAGPTPTCRPSQRQRGTWSLISHLTLNHLSLGSTAAEDEVAASGEGAAALRAILELYDFNRSESMQKRIAGIIGLECHTLVERIPSAPSGFSRGTAVLVDFDEEQFRDPGQGLFLFSTLLERYFGMYCSLNSFTRMTARTNQGERVLREWPPNTGDRYLL